MPFFSFPVFLMFFLYVAVNLLNLQQSKNDENTPF